MTTETTVQRAIRDAYEAIQRAYVATSNEDVERFLADALGSIKLAYEFDSKPRPTDAQYLEYRPVGAGHDAPEMPF